MHERFLNDIDDPELWQAKRQATVSLFNLLESGRCRHQTILRHFGEKMGRCTGSCDSCTGVSVAELASEAMMGAVKTASSRRTSHVSSDRDRTETTSRNRAEARSRSRRVTGASQRKADPAKNQAGTPTGVHSTTHEEEALFESLRSLRKNLADAQRVPAYIVFSDKVLWELAARRPATAQEMLAVPGVGPAKLERYGHAFLEVLKTHPGPPS